MISTNNSKEKSKRPNGYWNIQRIHSEALKFTTKNEFRNGAASAYVAAKRLGCLHDVSQHFTGGKAVSGFWTKDIAQHEAAKYKSVQEFRLGSARAYDAAKRHGWLQDIGIHFVVKKRGNGYWSKARVHEEAMKYKSRDAFAQGSSGAYQASVRDGYYESVCSHMIPDGHQLYAGYVIINRRMNMAYVGITTDLERRKREHLSIHNDTRSRLIACEHDTEYVDLTAHVVNVSNAREFEVFLYEEYSIMGFDMLNQKGSLGLIGCFAPS